MCYSFYYSNLRWLKLENPWKHKCSLRCKMFLTCFESALTSTSNPQIPYEY